MVQKDHKVVKESPENEDPKDALVNKETQVPTERKVTKA